MPFISEETAEKVERIGISFMWLFLGAIIGLILSVILIGLFIVILQLL